MKPQYLFFWLLAMMATISHAQTIRRCNSNPGVTGPNMYSSIQAAHDASANGDIIYLEASGTSYGTLTCAKRLTIYGRGYWLDTSPIGSDTQTEASMGAVSFATGSSNTTMSGCLVNGTITFGPGTSAITVERTYCLGIIFNSTCTGASSQFATNCTIKQCFVGYNYTTSGGIGGTCGTIENNANRITIQNCIVSYNLNWPIRNLNNCLISNTIFYGVQNILNSTVTNSLLAYGGVSGSYSGTTFTNCLTLTNSLPAGNGNQNGVNFNSVYVSNTANPSGRDTEYKLGEFSPALGAGINGTDVGAFGGPNPYVLSGQPPIPIITNLVSPPSGNNNAPLNVKISVRSNN
jgi:hypothetical protein